MHWAAHGQTAAEVIAARADAGKPHMGLATWPGTRPSQPDVVVAKNYLNEKELSDLNVIVSLYLDFAELQARSRRVMTMRDWITKLDDFTTIHKFMPEGGGQMAALSGRENIVVIADEPDQTPRYSLGISFTV